VVVADPTAATARRVKADPGDAVDVAIVGAGLGGLLAGAVLARRGLRVAVFDRHYVAGGCGTMFKRGPASSRWVFDVGMHYVGDAGPEGRVPAMLDAAGADVAFRALDPEGYDRVHVPGAALQIPWTIDAYRDALVDRFPHERRGIDRYVSMLRQVSALSEANLAADGQTDRSVIWTAVTRALTAVRFQHATAHDVVSRWVRDPVLYGLLFGLNGCYGVGPRRVSAMMHFGLCAHFFRGGYYPEGGGQRIADALAGAIEAAGGTVCLRTGIRRIEVAGGVSGVTTDDGRTVAASAVISNACVRRTLLELVPREALPTPARLTAEGWQMAVGIHLLSLGLRGSHEEAGIRRGNEWVTDSFEIDAMYDAIRDGDQSASCQYITSGSAKDAGTPGHAPEGHCTLQAMTFVSGRPEHWGVTLEDLQTGRYRDRQAYKDRKRRLDDRLVARLDRLYGDLSSRIVFAESATPLTHARYTSATGGTAYGLEATPSQFLAGRPGPVGPVDGLFLAGAGTRTAHGIIGSLNSGWIAAKHAATRLGKPLPELQGWRRGRVVTPR
jgi:phytoene dehydrogenase-like protein